MNTTTSTGTVPTPKASTRVSGISEGGSRARMDFGALTQAYNALPMTAKVGWKGIADTLNAQQGRVGRHKLSAANAYSILGSGCLAAGMPLPTDAPASIAPPPLMPKVTVQASNSGMEADGTTSFSLTVAANTAYSHMVQVLAAAPNPGKTVYPEADFIPIEVLSTLPDTPVDLAQVYFLRYGTPELGAQIALRLVAISPAGVRLSPLLVCATVTTPDAAAYGSGDTDELRRAA